MKDKRAFRATALIAPLALCIPLSAHAEKYPGSFSPVVNIPAAAFSTDGEDPANCMNYGDRAEAIGSSTQYLHAAVY